MIFTHDKPFFNFLSHLRNDSPWELVPIDNKAPDSRLDYKDWNLIRFNKSKEFRDFFCIDKSLDLPSCLLNIQQVVSGPHKHRKVSPRAMRHLGDNVLASIKNKWITEITPHNGIIHLKETFIYLIDKNNEGVHIVVYSCGTMWSHIGPRISLTLQNNGDLQDFNVIGDRSLPDNLILILANSILKTLFFLEYGRTETTVVNNKSKKAKVDGEKYRNDTGETVEIVGAPYYTNIIRTDGFKVKGHWRFQPYGAGRTRKELIWIDEFEKHGYTRTAKLDSNDYEGSL